MKISRQIEVNIYVSTENNLCIAVDDNDLLEIDGKKVIIITESNAHNFKDWIEIALSNIDENSLQEMMGE